MELNHSQVVRCSNDPPEADFYERLLCVLLVPRTIRAWAFLKTLDIATQSCAGEGYQLILDFQTFPQS